jgi:ribulose-phosphate 3-epimerase
VQRIKALGKTAGVAINPATPAALLEEIPDLDQVLVMTAKPDFGHQHFLHENTRQFGGEAAAIGLGCVV